MIKILTWIHTAISLVAIVAGLMVVKGLIESRGRQLWTLLFLVTAAATTLTGFFFPFQGPTPAFILGVISILPLTLSFHARYRHRLHGAWRKIYTVSAVTVLYFNCFVLIVQIFLKIPAANALAPTQKEPPFVIVQGLTLAAFIVLGILSTIKFKLTSFSPETAINPDRPFQRHSH